MTDVNQLLTTPDTGPNGQIKRDRWGRYLLPHPATGKEQAWTRVTTVAGTLEDRFGLEQWDQRNIVWGIGQRQDLYAKAAAAKLDDKDTLNTVIDEAQGAAQATSGRNLGSALHQFTERIDRGEDLTIPSPYDRDVNAYRQSLDAADIAVVLGWVERIVILPDLGIAGTLDRLCDGYWGSDPRVGDLKTGKDVIKYGMQTIPVQLALYAHASHWWTGTDWEPMPPVDQIKAIVMHAPAGQGVCTLYEVDIQAGWQAVQLAVAVRNWRKRKDLAQQIPAVPRPAVQAAATGTPATTSPVTAGVPVNQTLSTARVEWIRARVQQIVDHGHGPTLAAKWNKHPDIPTFKAGGPTSNQQIDLISQMCDQVEKETGMPFGASDPATPPQTKKERTRA